MTNKRTTKRALLSSVVALFLCFAMLIGTTYAWFTDSVTSANNIIKSGNLDITLEYWNGTKWNNVEGASDILTGDRWEPGYSDVAYLRIKNAGSLALKYQLGVNIVSETAGVNAEGNTFLLSNYIYFGVADVNGEANAYATREAALAAVTEPALISTGYTVADSLAAGSDYKYLAMIVYMPAEVNNDANHNGTDIPQIDLGINVIATQAEAELDGFKDSSYDKDAWADGMKVYSAEDLQSAVANGESVVLENDIEITEPIVVPASETATYSLNRTPATVINLNGNTITTAYDETTNKHQYAVDNYGNLIITGGTIEARGIYNQDGATLTIENAKVVNLDANGGSCVWSYGGEVYLNNAELIGYTGCVYSMGYLEINGGKYTCYGSIADNGEWLGSPTYNIRSQGGLVINGGDFTSRHGVVAVNGGDAIINGGTFVMSNIIDVKAITSHVIYLGDSTSNVEIYGGTFNCDLVTAAKHGSSQICVDNKEAVGATAVVYGGTFNHNSFEKYVADGYKSVSVEDTFKVIEQKFAPANDEDSLIAAIAAGGDVAVLNDIAVESHLSVPSGANVAIDLNGYTISGTNTTTATHNDLFLVKGELTVSGGKVTLAHDATNMGWNGATSVFDVTAGGVLNIKDATVENLGGTDMNFAVHLNNWGEVTLNVVDSYLKATYMPVRVFNSGPDVNNVTIEGSTLDGGNHSFWVHNYAAADMGGKLYSGATAAYDEAKVLDRLNFDIYGNGNTFKTGKSAPVRYGFNSSLYFTADGAQFVTSYAALQTAISKGGEVVLGENITVEESINVPAGVEATLDLNGFNLTSEYVGADHFAMFTVPSGASLTVKGEGEVYAKTEFTESNRFGAIFQNAGEVVLEGGSYEINDNTTGKTWIISTIVDNRTSGASCQTVLTINGGDYTVSGNAKNLFRNYPQQGGTATIKFNGGQFNDRDGSVAYIWNQEAGSYLGELYFNGGVYDSGVVYEDYNGQSDIHIAEDVVINAYSGNN